ncbi:eva-1 homolog Bb [Tachysurus fulvidraco]|uniref:eva-1 homolog Bb n=1 Tax=Tachysurus fulvidraco TaxID=1234273 RepID=UPI000F500A96|nr:eva-1 homolog Bb [Tachysurus fulvidraco]XP_027030426.1 eva-1 homolog Bb [Tachysurus fulvidraco]XP_027030427.1 eva-1 homolog Bb [Tachysurus fulvidraco]XP_027030428.1 eva-1 homolog Bb [Tachysurus fulvidraco]XP_047675249.1 eva-1 homolog Bb [Tachysurus fulvidraco]
MNPVRKDMELLSNSMATYAHVKENTESFALYFMLGVCFGLLLALTLLILGFACRPRRSAVKKPSSSDQKSLKESSEEDEEERLDNCDEEDVPDVTVSPTSEQNQSNGTTSGVNVFSSADELERARRLEERERIVREIWRNGQPDILASGTGTLGRVHYH